MLEANGVIYNEQDGGIRLNGEVHIEDVMHEYRDRLADLHKDVYELEVLFKYIERTQTPKKAVSLILDALAYHRNKHNIEISCGEAGYSFDMRVDLC